MKTAVEWLIEEMHKNIDWIPIPMQEQAKEMEKEQHKVTAQDFYYGSHSFKDFEQYYNETFKQ